MWVIYSLSHEGKCCTVCKKHLFHILSIWDIHVWLSSSDAFDTHWQAVSGGPSGRAQPHCIGNQAVQSTGIQPEYNIQTRRPLRGAETRQESLVLWIHARNVIRKDLAGLQSAFPVHLNADNSTECHDLRRLMQAWITRTMTEQDASHRITSSNLPDARNFWQ